MKGRFIQAAAAAVLLGGLQVAQAAAIRFQEDGGAFITCADNAACSAGGLTDINPLVGVITVSGTIGDFLVNVSTGSTKPVITDPLMDLNSINIQTAAGAHTLLIEFSETGFTAGGTISGEFGGTIGAGGTVTATAFVDPGNALFVDGSADCVIGPFNTSPFAGTCTDGSAPAGTYSATQRLFLETTGPLTFSGDFEISVPEPATLALLGVGLGLFGFSMRRRQQAS